MSDDRTPDELRQEARLCRADAALCSYQEAE